MKLICWTLVNKYVHNFDHVQLHEVHFFRFEHASEDFNIVLRIPAKTANDLCYALDPKSQRTTHHYTAKDHTFPATTYMKLFNVTFTHLMGH